MRPTLLFQPTALVAVLATPMMLLWPSSSAHAADQGIASLGATGGMHIPNATTLESGEAAFSVGNAQDPKLGSYNTRQNYTAGFGLWSGLELFGRLAEYTTSNGTAIDSGSRDISANLKWQLPLQSSTWPKVAVGVTDLSGGANHFKSVYAVAGDAVGPLRWSLGYAHGTPALSQSGNAKVLDGTFGGVELRLFNTRASVLAESTGSASHVGLRYTSESLPWLGQAQIIGSLQRSLDAKNRIGISDDSSSFNLSIVLPLGADTATRNRRTAMAMAMDSTNTASTTAASTSNLPVATVIAANPQATATAVDPLPQLEAQLRAAGLDRVRVGTQGSMLLVEYENYRYLHNEADAMGLVLGLAAESASAGLTRVQATALKTGLPVQTLSVDAQAYRDYLRWGTAQAVLDGMVVDTTAAQDTAMAAAPPKSPAAKVHVTLSPLLNTQLGTEFGLFDYSLALQARASVPLWRGALAYADVVQPVTNSPNMEPGRAFDYALHRKGVQTVALQQSFWLSPRWFNSVGVGRYNYDDTAVQGESILYLPWGNDSLHLRASSGQGWTTSYRWRANADTWVEADFNQYTSGSRGPSLSLTRWFGDVALQMFARTDTHLTFVGLQISLPLTPRKGQSVAAVQLSGSPRFGTGMRTLVANGGCNCLYPGAIRPLALSYQAETELLNSGRNTPDYWRSQLTRMRESFYLYGPKPVQ